MWLCLPYFNHDDIRKHLNDANQKITYLGSFGMITHRFTHTGLNDDKLW